MIYLDIAYLGDFQIMQIPSSTADRGRLQEIDFLRGIAILLVIAHHHTFVALTARAGWAGVDLFFVLSGFLVSGLLFQEYIRYQNIQAGQFLIRRGFKIYPVFYTFIALSVITGLLAIRLTGKEFLAIHTEGVLGEIFFLQNYWRGLWIHTWSLAIEEHFYFLLAALLYLLSRRQLLHNVRLFAGICCAVFVTCLLLRAYLAVAAPQYLNLHQTHLRIDSLMFGAFISYLYHFRTVQLTAWVTRYKVAILIISLLCVSLTAALKLETLFMSTIGLSLLFIGFGGILLIFLFVPEYIRQAKKIITARVFDAIAWIGFYSYSIYLFHLFIKRYFIGALKQYIPLNTYTSFFLYAGLSILAGYIVARVIERPFLNLRETYFPKRTQANPIITEALPKPEAQS